MPRVEIRREAGKKPLDIFERAFGDGRRKKQKTPWYRWVLAFAFLLWCAWTMASGVLRSWWTPNPSILPPPVVVRDFDDIESSRSLKWTPCYDEYLCAKLTIPMDYKRSNPGTKHPIVEIALTMLPGKGHVETGQFGISPLLINPGGPGGSGTTFVMSGGKGIQQVVGLDQDIIGFDPRGIGASTPKADCFSFPSDRGASGRPPNKAETAKGVFHMATWAMSGEAIGLFDSSDAAPRQLDSRARAFAALCGAKDEVYGDNSIFKYIGTPAVARDMLSIVDAWDAWREKEEQSDAFWTTRSKDVSLDTKGKLVYWGFSYGSFLGATFAALFPDRVGRVINDGVVDADYYVSPFWEESLLNTEDVELSFFKFCHEGGKLCAFYREGDTEQDISDRFYQALERLKEKPVIGTQDITMTPAIITWEYYRTVIFSLLYFPQNSFPILAIFMSLIANNDVSTVTQLGGWSGALLDFTPFCGMKSAPYTGKDAQGGILCGDKRYPLNETVPELLNRYEKLSNTSSYADIWLTILLQCNTWPIETKTDPMPWDHKATSPAKKIKTAFPILFIGNTADPVTPLFAAVKMALKFEDAGLIEQQSEGHCSLSTVSQCTIAKIRAYFQEGKIPSVPEWGPEGKELAEGKWDRCERNETPFKPFNKQDWTQMMVTTQGGWRAREHIEEEAETLEAWRKMQWHASGQVGLVPQIDRKMMAMDFEDIKAWKQMAGSVGLM